MKRGFKRPKVVPEVFVSAIEPLLAAVDAGSLDETRRLYERDFNTTYWDWPADWEDHDGESWPFKYEDSYVAFTLLPECLRLAARRQHWHIVDWIIRDAKEEVSGVGWVIDDEIGAEKLPSLFMEQEVADALWEKTLGRDGTVTDALQMCGKGWWPQDLFEPGDHPRREAYEYRTFCDLSLSTTEREELRDWYGRLPVKKSFVWTKKWARENSSVCIFECCTPDFVSNMLDARKEHNTHLGYTHLVNVLILKALKTQLKTDATRWLGIAESLVDMGFAFEYHVLFELSKHLLHRRLLLKMMRIMGGKGGIAVVERHLGSGIPAIAKAHRNLLLVWVAFKMRVLAARARERAWSPDNVHVLRLKTNFAANACDEQPHASRHLRALALVRPPSRRSR